MRMPLTTGHGRFAPVEQRPPPAASGEQKNQRLQALTTRQPSSEDIEACKPSISSTTSTVPRQDRP